eukprot:TRINITY_DN1597_c0_g1_i1.p2 TRINITY_DN1597_c0_g1~~TRINITY_DN1597_c0_g1_i1.p2  ORF type:complete len:139 (-),score=30.23 TRINITY_DN1597_c0_g1_i1:569-985(-)
MIRRPPRSTQGVSSAASDVYKRQVSTQSTWGKQQMKRLSDDSSRNIKEENCLCYPLEEDGLLPWTQDEDFFLQKEISGNRRVSWRTLSIRFNKKFASSRRSCGECRKRWEDCEEAKWSNAEELLLLLGLHIYGEIGNC